jgi:hypothetical protein
VLAIRAGCKLALNHDACIEILRESGFLPDGPHFAAVILLGVLGGMNAAELDRFLRENGEEGCSPSLAKATF